MIDKPKAKIKIIKFVPFFKSFKIAVSLVRVRIKGY